MTNKSNKTVKIGTTAQNASAEATADREAVEALPFPRNLRVTNQMPIMLIFAEVGLQLIGNTRAPQPGEKNTAEVKFANEDQLKRFEADAEMLANIHGYDPAVLIEEIEDESVATETPAQTAATTETPVATETSASAPSQAA